MKYYCNENVQIAPSILAADFSDLGRECQAAIEAGCDWIHVDVMDGRFVPAMSFGAQMVATLRRHISVEMDLHLMIENTDLVIDDYIRYQPDRLTVHVETCHHLHRVLTKIKSSGIKAGIALNPTTSVFAIAETLAFVDQICVMTVNPGFGGQKFIESQTAKISAIRDALGNRPINIEVDGGVTLDNAKTIVDAGADVLVAGSAIFDGAPSDRTRHYRDRIQRIRRAICV